MNSKMVRWLLGSGFLAGTLTAGEPLFTIDGTGNNWKKDAVQVEAVRDGRQEVLVFKKPGSYLHRETPREWNGACTFLTWVKHETLPIGTQSMLCKIGYHTQLTTENGEFVFRTFTVDKNELIVKGGKPVLACWQMLAGICDPDRNELSLYLDGVLCRKIIMDKQLLPNNGKFTIGGANPMSATIPQWFTGKLNGVRVYSSALSAEEIMDLYEQERSLYSDLTSATKENK